MMAAVLLVAGTANFSKAATPAEAEFDKVVQPFLQQYCDRCHTEKLHEGEFRLDTLARDVANGPSGMKWAEVLERISSAQMPPADEPQPKIEDATKIVEWLAMKLKEGEATRLAKRELVTFNKLTRAEYANTVRDLLGVGFDATDPTGLAEDEAWHGFERIGSVLSLSPSHVEKYFGAAESILTEAFPEKPPVKFLKKKDALDLRGGGNREDLAAAGLADKVRVDLWPGHDLIGGRPGPGQALPAAGDYKVRIQLSGLQPKNGRAPHLTVYATDLDRMLFETDVVAPEDKPIVVEFTTHLPAGNLNLRVTNDVPGPSNLPRSGRSDPRIPFFSIKDGRRPWQMKLTDEEGAPLWPFLIVDWIEWSGPLVDDGPTYAQREYLPADSNDREQVRAALAKFTTRAFRRPARPEEVDRYFQLVESEMASGEKFLPAMKTAMLAILCSKNFIYLVEGSSESNEIQLNDFELASRLSYFIWSTMPDDELMAVAQSGKLREPAELKKQVRRLLADPRAARFAKQFPRNWLQLQMVGMFPPDKKLYPDYDSHLEQSMIGETTEYFREVLQQNLSLREFLTSDWTMINPRLAMHYELTSPTQDRFERVSLTPADHRGGLLTQAAILSLTSDGTRHRPVHRGKWVLESIVGKSPPPPPANVKPIEPTPAMQPKATLRMKLDAHKSDASCASCHKRIDPLGFAFDNYDAIGRWRTHEIVSDGDGDNPKVDASGEMVDGRKFANAEEFKQILAADLETFNAAFVEKLAIFATRRVMTIADRESLAKVAKQSKTADYKLQSVVENLVLSDLFQKR
ncbi:hypothetical protein ETAA8_05980 [Anatilimnocola aggregata]|uniref:DUF1592 domain-containing protein n=2 Tax=Anatilimnocola aggregata TaxID=2528021 RepID=A0A517Y5L1_9BACT|nr:hypothetical protein ETAA8_05980 [Anatilimnocola aggregata]